MRKILFYILSSLLVVFTACEYNEEHFPELDELVTPVDIRLLEDSLEAEDYAAIADLSANKALAKADGVEDELANLESSQSFSEALPAKTYMLAYLAELWPTLDNTSTVKVTYNFQQEYPAYLTELSGVEVYELTAEDYEDIWNDQPFYYLTPDKSLARNANDVLSAAYPEAEEDAIKVIAYNYSDEEPADYVDPVVTSINEDFSSVVTYEPVDLSGWINYAEVGEEYWEGRSYSGNTYPQFSAYGTGGEAIAWLISPEINLAEAASPVFSFDVNLGYFNAYLMQVLISEDYDEGDPTVANWTDVTHQFAIYSAASGYTNLYVAGVMDMSDYQENTFRVAFRYAGDANDDKTTTYQVDNLQIGDETTVVSEDAFSEDFAGGLDNWSNIVVQGTKEWSVSSYSNEFRAVYSAYGTTGEQEGWLVSPGITVPATGASQLLVDMAVGYHNANCLSVLVSEDFAGDVTTATWTDVTGEFSFPVSTGGYSDVVSAGAATLNAYKGKEIFVAFKYLGNAEEDRTTTYQIYDVNVKAYSRSVPDAAPGLKSASAVEADKYALYTYNGSAWEPYGSAVILNGSDYSAMGISNFSSSNKTEDYLPNYLEVHFPYALEGDVQTVAFFYGNRTNLSAEDYEFSNGVWTKVDMKEAVTDQFVKTNGSWLWNPSVVINLGPVRNDPFIMSYYQAASDWVWENIDVPAGAAEKGDGYVSGYGNNEYYAGTSAYYNNVDMRPQSARNQNPAAYGDLSDEEITALMMERLAEVMGAVLSQLHPEATPIEGVDITYTVNVGIYTGETISDVTHTIVYKVVGVGEFELVSGPDPIE
ncbi:choice-of-anchor J domain-containing protein [Geofilum rubicundum]|uniref:DUF5017 domain-containing protein n=1 Tax=Geofilum rubicundum JCM 15548 TaxID=1236989 RepID=A0A0E9LVC2_9BACT|nr:choice-of-anchor J domain-containing protein [Geofilum rubicundum]GAO29517.1 hypothetical protein JCM15548_11710 [Geofilum rubicundum JCM 15548]